MNDAGYVQRRTKEPSKQAAAPERFIRTISAVLPCNSSTGSTLNGALVDCALSVGCSWTANDPLTSLPTVKCEVKGDCD